MTDPNPSHAQSPNRARRLLLVVVTALSGMTLTHSSFAASTQPHKTHSTVGSPAHHAPAPRPAARPTKAAAKSKHAQAQAKTQRKAPAKTRVAAKSKTEPRAHQTPRKPTRVATKKTKQAA